MIDESVVATYKGWCIEQVQYLDGTQIHGIFSVSNKTQNVSFQFNTQLNKPINTKKQLERYLKWLIDSNTYLQYLQKQEDDDDDDSKVYGIEDDGDWYLSGEDMDLREEIYQKWREQNKQN